MSTLHEAIGGSRVLCVKGDPVEVLARWRDPQHGRWRRAARRCGADRHSLGQ